MSGFEIRDVECIREHYALTLRHWLHGLEAHADEARRLTNEFTYRVFRLYLAASAFGFEIGQPSIYQSVFVKLDDGRSGLPLTRADWYSAMKNRRLIHVLTIAQCAASRLFSPLFLFYPYRSRPRRRLRRLHQPPSC